MAELAGLALTVFPLVIRGISAYVQCRDVWRWKVAMNGVLRGLQMENVLFQNTCTNILQGTCQPDLAADLLRGVGWDADFVQHLQSCWGVVNAKVFIDAMTHMGTILTEAQEQLGFVNGVLHLPVDGDKRSRKRKWKQIWAVLQRADCLAEIKSLNLQLERLATHLRSSSVRFSNPSAVVKQHSHARELAVNLHDVFQENLQDISSCACHTHHNATLRLPRVRELAAEASAAPIPIRFEVLFPLDSQLSDAGTSWRGLEFEPSNPVSTGSSTVGAASDSPGDDVTCQKSGATGWKVTGGLRGVFGSKSSQRLTPTSSAPCSSTPTSGWQGVKKAVRYATDASVTAAALGDTTAPSSGYSNTEPIENLCSAIRNASSRKPGVPPASMPMGALLGEQDIRWQCLQPRSMIAFPFETIRALPLDVVLLNGGLKPAETLTLGVQIALAMMQLHTTQWLGDDWSKKDIFILHRAVTRQVVGSGQRMVIWEPILEHPFVHRIFDGQPRPISAAESVADYNRCLFSLGVVLIELALGKPIEELGTLGTIDYHDQPQDSRADSVRTTAMNCIGYVYSKEAPAYGDAVERCINGLRLPEPIPKVLNNPQYKNEVQAKIVSVLERNLRVYLGYPT